MPKKTIVDFFNKETHYGIFGKKIKTRSTGCPKKITLLKFLLMIMALVVVIKMMDDGGGDGGDDDGDGDVGG